MFAGYFTLDQVKGTLLANKDDPDRKNKSIKDLKYKQGMSHPSPLLTLTID